MHNIETQVFEKMFSRDNRKVLSKQKIISTIHNLEIQLHDLDEYIDDLQTERREIVTDLRILKEKREKDEWFADFLAGKVKQNSLFF